MPPVIDPRHLVGLLGSAGKSLARVPEAERVGERLRDARSPAELARLLAPLDLGLAPPARRVVEQGLAQGPHWEERRAALLHSFDLAHAERFESGA
ncbi:MAG: hypothetical protein QOE90_176 [Thermoplasmata archaeon]|jgi:hypothetical protein|nr:hypothetical protein [Thermoplasmata archaeon]